MQKLGRYKYGCMHICGLHCKINYLQGKFFFLVFFFEVNTRVQHRGHGEVQGK